MNLLNNKCSHCGIASFRDKYIFKFGGTIENSEILIEMY